MAAQKELIIFIHGVNPDTAGQLHTVSYAALRDGVGRLRPDSVWKDTPDSWCDVEWGWEDGRDLPGSQHKLTQAQFLLGERTMGKVINAPDWSINPGRLLLNSLRPLILYGFGDMFYYVSHNGKRDIREHVAAQIMKCCAGSNVENLSLTLVGHSAGSVIAFDLCFALFAKSRDAVEFFAGDPTNAAIVRDFDRLREMADNGHVRIRKLITLGSPITMLASRSNPVVELLAAGKKLDPAEYGLLSDPPAFGPAVEQPRWINIWEKDDPISWPVEPLMDLSAASNLIEDHVVDIDDRVSRVHGEYWTSGDVHELIAEYW
jgi:hypothetical protein